MADYKEMYLTLFRKVTKAIALLQEAQIEVEEKFLASDDAPISVLHPGSEAMSNNSKSDD